MMGDLNHTTTPHGDYDRDALELYYDCGHSGSPVDVRHPATADKEQGEKFLTNLHLFFVMCT